MENPSATASPSCVRSIEFHAVPITNLLDAIQRNTKAVAGLLERLHAPLNNHTQLLVEIRDKLSPKGENIPLLRKDEVGLRVFRRKVSTGTITQWLSDYRICRVARDLYSSKDVDLGISRMAGYSPTPSTLPAYNKMRLRKLKVNIG